MRGCWKSSKNRLFFDSISHAEQNMNNINGSGKCGDDLQWILYENGQLVISGQGNMYDYSEGNTPRYADSASITSVEIQSGVTSIGTGAFSSLKKLKTLSIPGSVSHIGKNAFRDTFKEQCDPVCHVADGFSSKICNEGYGELFSAIYYTRIVALFSRCLSLTGYEEPMYHEVKFMPDEEAPSTFVTQFFDEQGRRRKEYTSNYHYALESLDAYDENGGFRGSMVVSVARSEPVFYLKVYLPADNARGCKEISFTMSLKDYKIRIVQ